MQCETCRGKMRCTYSVPAGLQVRYRVYRCQNCNVWLETTELSTRMYESGSGREDIAALVKAAERRRLVIIKRTKGKATG